MKKFLCIALSLLCIFSLFSFSISAEDAQYYISYEPSSGSQATYTFMPSPTVLETAGYANITTDKPIVSGYTFKYWADANGQIYQPGDVMYVGGPTVLYPVLSKGSGGTLEEISSAFDDQTLYCITYQNQTLSNVSMMYKPNPTVSFKGPGYVTVTKDTPIAVDHDFVCWKDGNGKYYYEGDKVYINGTVTLYAVWEEKTDNNIRPTRVIKCALATLERIILKFLGVFKDIQDFDATYVAPENTTTVVTP